MYWFPKKYLNYCLDKPTISNNTTILRYFAVIGVSLTVITTKFALKKGSQQNSVVITCSQTAILNASSRQEKPKQLLTTSLRQRGRAEMSKLQWDLKLL